MNQFFINAVPVAASQKFRFCCTQCGECCRHVFQSIPIESLDLYRIAKYLRDHDGGIDSMDEVLLKYAVPVTLHQSGYFLFMLKTAAEDEHCVFLKENKCLIHPVKPRACRTYPIEAGPSEKGFFEYILSMEKPHHFTGPKLGVREWVRKYLSQEEREFVAADCNTAVPLVRLLEKIPKNRQQQAQAMFLFYRYSNFDLDKPFLEQFNTNQRYLISALEKLL